MGTWRVLEEQTGTSDGEAAAPRRVKIVETFRDKGREAALHAFADFAKKHRPAPIRGTRCVVGRDSDGSFWVLPENGKGDHAYRLRLVEEV